MRFCILLPLLAVAMLLDTTISGSGAAPRCTLALLAWIALQPRDGVHALIWAVAMGMVFDILDPSTHFFHGVFFVFAALVVRFGRLWLFPDAPFSAALLAGILVLLQVLFSALIWHAQGFQFAPLLLAMLSTAAVAGFLTLLLSPLARDWKRA